MYMRVCRPTVTAPPNWASVRCNRQNSTSFRSRLAWSPASSYSKLVIPKCKPEINTRWYSHVTESQSLNAVHISAVRTATETTDTRRRGHTHDVTTTTTATAIDQRQKTGYHYQRKPVKHHSYIASSANRTNIESYRKPKNSHVIALEGLIGVGKSTLCNKLLDIFPNEIDVYKEQTNESFLQLFYADPAKYGFALQWGMLKSRIYQLRLAQHDVKYGRIPPIKYFYWDRSMIGDYIFALWNHLQGSISAAEMAVYESEFGGSLKQLELVSFLNDIDLFVFMDDEPVRCKERVELLRKNPSEQGIPISYYNGLDDMHFHILLSLLTKKLSKAVVVGWHQFQNPAAMHQLFTKVISGTVKAPSVEAANLDEVEAAGENCVVYRTEADINDFYAKLVKARGDPAKAQDLEQHPLKVYIPENIMTIDPQEKGIIANDYNINFYQNAYKRVVMWHLSQRHEVMLYRAINKP